MSDHRCTACGSLDLALLDTDGPPDPDRWGNRRWFFKCGECGERPHVLHGPHGGTEHVGMVPVDDRGHPTVDRPDA